MSLIDLHEVTKFEDFKSNFSQVREIKQFIENPGRVLLISGSLGTGKSTILSIIENECKNDTEILKLSNASDYQNEYVNFTTKRSIENLIFQKKKLVLVDDMHLFDKAFLSSLKTSCVPVVGTFQTKEELKIQDLRKSVKCGAKYLKLNRITLQDCLILISDVIERNGMTERFPCDNVMKTIKECKCNVRQILHSLMFANDAASEESGGQLQTIERRKAEFSGNFLDMNVYELTAYFMKHKVDEKFVSLNITGILSYVIHENFCTLFETKTRDLKVLETYEEYLKIITDNDDQYFENYAYETKPITDYLLNHRLNGLMLRTNINATTKLKFTTVFNKLSIKSAFNKKMNIYTQAKASYCDPLSDLVVGGDEGGQVEQLRAKMLSHFTLE